MLAPSGPTRRCRERVELEFLLESGQPVTDAVDQLAAVGDRSVQVKQKALDLEQRAAWDLDRTCHAGGLQRQAPRPESSLIARGYTIPLVLLPPCCSRDATGCAEATCMLVASHLAMRLAGTAAARLMASV